MGSHYDQILQGLSSKLEATSKGYMLESYCRTRNIDMNDMIRPIVRRNPKAPPAATNQVEQNQIDHDHRIAEKKLALEKIRLERAKVAHQQEQLKVHKVLDNGAILMKDGSVKTEQSPQIPVDDTASKAVDAPQSPPRTDPDVAVPPTPSPSPDPASAPSHPL
jgi:hypothetical protein